MKPPHLLNYWTYRPHLYPLSALSRVIGVIFLCFLLISGAAQPIPLPLTDNERGLRDFEQQPKLTANGGEAGDEFGYSVALNAAGDLAVIGAIRDEPVARGAVYVFARTDATWTQQARLIASDGDTNAHFGEVVALSDDGSTILVGVPDDDIGEPEKNDQGSAYVFTRSGDNWTEHKLIASDGVENDWFGGEVALSADGNTAIIGASGDEIDAGVLQRGSAYVFTRSGTNWSFQQKLINNNGVADDYFGSSVALSDDGNTALVTASEEDIGANEDQGAAYIFTRSGITWTQHNQPLIASNGADFDFFGNSAALSGDGKTALLGSWWNDVGGKVDQGSAYVFVLNGADWVQQQMLFTAEDVADDHWGNDVAISDDGNIALVGGRLDDIDPNPDQGSVYLYTREGTNWTPQQRLTASDGAGGDRFGQGVALNSNGNTALVGASSSDPGGNLTQGSAYVFRNIFTDCDAVTTVPTSECNTLLALYDDMTGANWINNLNWLEHVDPCKWFGVICTGGNITALNLFKNGLVGNISPQLGDLTELTALNLAGNRLTGNIPASFSNLNNLQFGATSVDYNLLTATDSDVIALLNIVNPSWDETQTIPPTNVAAVGSTIGFVINWTPILYQADNGHYTVSCNSGSFTAEAYTTNKSVGEVVISGLPAGTYTCSVHTFTPAHANNASDLTSATVATAPVNYAGQDVPPNDPFDNPILFDTYPYQNYSLNIANATRTDDPLPPPGNPDCLVSLPSTAVGIHYKIPGDLDTDGVVLNVGGPVWYSNRRMTPRETGIADTAIVIYEETAGGEVGAVVACDDDNAAGEVSVSNVNFELDPNKTYRAVVWNEAEAPEGAIIEIAAASFDLESPADDSASLDAPATFTWRAYANTVNYYFKVARTSDDPLSKFSLVELTPAQDEADSLICDGAVCTLTVVSGSDLASYLTDGNYLWSVGANMSAEDTTLPLVNSNQIFRFIIGEQIEINLLTNGNFETDNNFDKQPDGWTGKALLSDKLKCNKPDKVVAYEGVCAFMFKGGSDENAAISQDVDGSGLVAGQSVTLGTQIRGSGIAASTKIVVNVKYINGSGTKQKLGFAIGSIEDYTLFKILPINILNAVSSIKITIKSKRLTGKLFVDDLRLTTVSQAIDSIGAELLPLPPVSGLTASGQ